MIVNIEAKFACDNCGTEFFTPLDPAKVPLSEWSLFDVAEDSIRAGFGYYDGHDDDRGIGSGSVGGDGRHYCARCTRKYDSFPDGDDPRITQQEPPNGKA